jgi:hypothetical protein
MNCIAHIYIDSHSDLLIRRLTPPIRNHSVHQSFTLIKRVSHCKHHFIDDNCRFGILEKSVDSYLQIINNKIQLTLIYSHTHIYECFL